LLPVTVTFYSHKRDSAEAVQIALVDEAIAILLFAVQNLERLVFVLFFFLSVNQPGLHSKGIDRFSLLQIRNVISVLIAQADTRLFLHSLSVSDAPIPDIRCLQSADIPIDAIEYSQSMQKQVARRHSLKSTSRFPVKIFSFGLKWMQNRAGRAIWILLGASVARKERRKVHHQQNSYMVPLFWQPLIYSCSSWNCYSCQTSCILGGAKAERAGRCMGKRNNSSGR